MEAASTRTPDSGGNSGQTPTWRYCMVWEQALHRCQGLPPNQEIWLNHIEKPEYWVMNWNDDPCGEHIEICPFCHANLACGEGDAVLIKADDGWWRILGFMEAE